MFPQTKQTKRMQGNNDIQRESQSGPSQQIRKSGFNLLRDVHKFKFWAPKK